MHHKKIAISLALALTSFGQAMGQVQQQWVVKYDGATFANSDDAVDTEVDREGNVVVLGLHNKGISPDTVILKYKPDGSLFPGFPVIFNGPNGGVDLPRALALDRHGNIFTTGRSDAFYTPGVQTLRMGTRMLSPDGVLLHEWFFDNADGYDLAIGPDGNPVVTGAISKIHGTLAGQPVTANDAITVKYDVKTGAQLWASFYDFIFNDTATVVKIDTDGSVYIAGGSSEEEPLLTPAYSTQDYFTAKYSGNTGTLLWSARYGVEDNHDIAHDLVITPTSVVVTGETASAFYGTIFYSKTHGTPQGPVKIYQGNLSYPGSDAWNIVADAAGNVFVSGHSWISENGNETTAITTIAYSASGTELWRDEFTHLHSTVGAAGGIVLDSLQRLTVCGYSFDGSSDSQVVAVQYDAATGDRLSVSTFDGTGGMGDEPGQGAIAADLDGNVYIAGRTFSGKPPSATPTWFDVFTWKLSPIAGVGSYGEGTSGCKGPHDLYVNGAPTIGQSFGIVSSEAPADSSGILALSGAQIPGGLTSLGISFLIDPASPLVLVGMTSNSVGIAQSTLIAVPNNPALAGMTFYGQAFFNANGLCQPSSAGFSSSEGLSLTIQP